MDSFELNKITGAILGTLLFVMGGGFLAEAIYHPIEGRGPGLALAEAEVPTEGGAAAAPEEQDPPIAVRLQTASAEAGDKAVNKCRGCHKLQATEGNSTGPLLYGVVGRPLASHEGFSYSTAMQEHGAAGEVWSYEHLDAFIKSPKDTVPGTKMGFGGVKDPTERANILAYLATLSDNPVPFPAPDAAPATDAAPAAEDPSAAPTNANAVEPNTETQGEQSNVQGTPVSPAATSTPPGTAGGAAPGVTDAPSPVDAPAMNDAAPAGTNAQQGTQPAPAAPAGGQPAASNDAEPGSGTTPAGQGAAAPATPPAPPPPAQAAPIVPAAPAAQ